MILIKQIIQQKVINKEINYFKNKVKKCPFCKQNPNWNIKHETFQLPVAIYIAYPYYTCTCNICNSKLVRLPLVNEVGSAMFPKKVKFKVKDCSARQDNIEKYDEIITLADIVKCT